LAQIGGTVDKFPTIELGYDSSGLRARTYAPHTLCAALGAHWSLSGIEKSAAGAGQSEYSVEPGLHGVHRVVVDAVVNTHIIQQVIQFVLVATNEVLEVVRVVLPF
jgi:hypothetical protein